jgi:hypothetical protein
MYAHHIDDLVMASGQEIAAVVVEGLPSVSNLGQL